MSRTFPDATCWAASGMGWFPLQGFETGEDGVDVAGVGGQVERGGEIDARGDLLLPGPHRGALHEPVRVVAGEPRLDERAEDALGEEQEVARLEVAAHPLGPHDETLDEPREAVEHVVEGEERVG